MTAMSDRSVCINCGQTEGVEDVVRELDETLRQLRAMAEQAMAALDAAATLLHHVAHGKDQWILSTDAYKQAATTLARFTAPEKQDEVRADG